jgi:hypothetical protein
MGVDKIEEDIYRAGMELFQFMHLRGLHPTIPKIVLHERKTPRKWDESAAVVAE